MPLTVVSSQEVEPSNIAMCCCEKIYIAHVKIDQIKGYANELIQKVGDTSWISQLNIIAREAYETAVIETVEKLVQLFNTVDNQVTSEFGQYAISFGASQTLCEHFAHTEIKLAELWKEQISGNPGFDFHTISPNMRIIFGEAKYNSRDSAYDTAAKQVVDFLLKNKHKRDLPHLTHFAPKESINKLANLNEKGVTLAFSIHSKDHSATLINALQNEHIEKILGEASEIYLIGIEV